jgi:hypothetical protein
LIRLQTIKSIRSGSDGRKREGREMTNAIAEEASATKSFTAARNGATEGRLELTRGGTHITVRAAEHAALWEADFGGARPTVAADGGRVAITYPRFSFADLLRHPGHSAEIGLSPALPWSLVFDGGLGESSLDLRGLDLRRFEVAGGVGRVQLLLPEPRAVVPVTIGGGASRLDVLRPAGVAVQLRIAGGATRLVFDGKEHPPIGGARLETPNASSATERYEIEIRGGASEVSIGES